jgi:hypothetical protein
MSPPLRRILTALGGLGLVWGAGLAPQAQAQWIAYTFSPQAAYKLSYGMTTNTGGSLPSIQINGWPSSWNNPAKRGVLAIYFSTNTNSGNTLALLPPLIYDQSTSTNRLTTNDFTNFAVLNFTNTNVSGAASVVDPVSLAGRVNYGSRVYLAGNLSTLLVDASSDPMTNILISFSELCGAYNTNAIGTNGVPAGTNYYPPKLSLRISTLSRASDSSPFTNSQQLILPLTLNPNLTKIMNTNALFGAAALTDPLAPANSLVTNAVYTNLPKLIRSNSTYANP